MLDERIDAGDVWVSSYHRDENDPGDVEARVEHRDENDPENDAGEAANTSADQDASDHSRRDRKKLVSLAEAALRDCDPRCQHDAADAGHGPAQCVGENLMKLEKNAGDPRAFAAAADGKDVE